MSQIITDTKPHYDLLDGLRGVAALIVIGFHLFECYPDDHIFSHGYLAVEFFFILSGFVIGYAYDERWKNNTMTISEFLKRRVVRLHPMVVVGVVLGVIAYCVQGCEQWDHTPVAWIMVLLAALCSFFMLPALGGSAIEVRGFGEMFPLNGPMWSLFFEYIGSFLYALILHRLSSRILSVIVSLSAVGILVYAVNDNWLGEGWAVGEYGYGFLGGFLLMSFSFTTGLLMSRKFKPIKIRGAFWICTVALIILFAIPNFGSKWDGIYEAVCVIFVLPLLVYIGASGKVTDKWSSFVCKFLGDISYPVYIVHYPFMYLFYWWVWSNNIPLEQGIKVMYMLVPVCILVAYLCLKFYDEPIRRYLSHRFLYSRNVK